ncbi:TonB-dependent receptor [Eilatimonas milleporae]|uniref:Outer membrane receptor protein involved in Fe transport n=1 Tax=Eilatimonas milleporae TaxID=911205 RepID=A0A3M0C2I8_9PROT|nr:TonB-dependent receptor [Eilatimonas milleporae]RMB02877.1 outer membrane receptor protein involved in Fe transport [Eilatimonas milleporae]
MRFNAGVSLVALAAASGITNAPAHGEEDRIEEIQVTATKRMASTQDIPVAVSALTGAALDDLDVDVFVDYLQQLPGVNAGGSGPGQSTIYIRGLASTTPNLTTAGVAGLAPNVALYLDEQPLAQPGRNLDVYAADLERVEVLAGPQGTLFGASSQAGTIRLITNKPRLNETEAITNFGIAFTKGGEMSTKVEGIINLPVTEKLAVRAVAYVDDQGGYIDNVAGTRSARESARFRPAGTMRANGVPVSAQRAGFQGTADLSDVTFLDADNSAIAEDDFNDTQYTGFRFGALYEFNADWRLTVTHARQSIESDGVFFIDPEIDDDDDLSVSRFEDDRLEDDFSNTSWTVEGRLGALDVVYSGAFTDRETDQRVDYTDYLFVGQYLPYYICDSSVSYPGEATPSGTCQPPNMFVNSTTDTTVQTHELRFNTPAENRLRLTAGGFYSDLQLDERNDYTYPGSIVADVFGSPGFSPNFPFTTGFRSDDGPFPAGVIFRNDVRRTDEQFGVFGEATFDVVPDLIAVTFGARYYDIEVDFEGSANASFCNSFQADANAFGTDISDIYNGDGQVTFRGSCDTSLHQTFDTSDTVQSIVDAIGVSEAQAGQIINAINAPDVAETSGVIFKANISITPTEDTLFYATFSEGFRPGLLNRPGGALGPDGFVVPFELETDEVINYEIGWKLDLFEGQVRFNGNAFFVDVQNLQTTIFDPSIVNLFFSANAADAEIYGVEGDFIYAPAGVEGLTFAGAFSILDTEITDVLVPTDDVIEGSELAFAPSFSANLRARYEWDAGRDMTAYIQPQIVHTGSQRSDIIEINAAEIDDWTTFGFAAGVRRDAWSVDLFLENITDTRGELANNFVFDRERVTVIRPFTAGLRLSYRY